MGVYEFELKSIISPKCVELRLSSNDRYVPKFLSPVAVLHVVAERVVVLQQDGQKPIITERHLCIEMPDWKARAEGLLDVDQFPASSADKRLKAAANNPDKSVTTRKVNMSMTDYLASIGREGAAA